MKQAHLKYLRLALAILFLTSTGFLFLDFREILNVKAFTVITWLQFVPSLIKFITAAGLVSAGFMAVLALTSLFGRVYCSTICPLGILQDIVSWIRKKTQRKTKITKRTITLRQKFAHTFSRKRNRIFWKNPISDCVRTYASMYYIP